MRAHPHLYEINTWPWLDELSRRAGRHLTLDGVPDGEWDHLERRGIDIVYLMGIWKRSAVGRWHESSPPSSLVWPSGPWSGLRHRSMNSAGRTLRPASSVS